MIGANTLCFALWIIIVWAWCSPDRVGVWVAKFEAGKKSYTPK